MSKSATILRNIASNWFGFAINVAVALALTPFILRELGVARYGVWVLTSSIIGYYGMLDLGFRDGVIQYLTRYLAMGDYDKGSECISSAVAALSALGVVMAGLSLAAAFVAPQIFHFPPGVKHEAFWCILIIGCTSAMQFAFMPFTSVFTAMQRFDLANLISVGTRLLTAGGVLVALRMGDGLIGVSVATCGANSVDYLIRWRVACRLAPQLEFSRRRINLKRLRETASFGAWNFLISISSYVYFHIPNIIIGLFMPIAAVGHYALAAGLKRHIRALLNPVGQVFYPAATELHVRADQSGLKRLYHDGSRLMLLVMIPIVLMAAFWAKDFYRLWIGEKYLSGEPFHSVAVLFQILLISAVTYYSSNIAGQILLGSGQVRPLAKANIFGAALNLTIALILIGPYGLAGLAASTAIASVVVDLIFVPILLQRALGLSVKDFLHSACVRPVAAGLLQVILMGCIRLMGKPGDWLHLIFQGALAGLGSTAAVLMVGLTNGERHRYLVQPVRRLLRRTMPAEGGNY